MPRYYETAPHALAAGIAFPIIGIIAVALKFKVRRIQNQPLKADDWTLVPATLFTFAIGIAISHGATHEAIGWPLKERPDTTGDTPPEATSQERLARTVWSTSNSSQASANSQTVQIQYIFLILYPLALGSTKLSLLFLYKRIFSISRRTRLVILATIGVVAGWMISIFFAELFQCNTRFWANWGSSYDLRTQCNRTTMIVFAVALTDSLLDLTILSMPIPMILQLRLSTGRKVGVLSIFLLGVVTVTASIVRLALIIPLVFTLYEADVNHRFVSITTSVYWGMVEAGIGILVACLPTLQFMLRKNRWRAIIGQPVSAQQASTGNSIPHSFKLKLGSNPEIQVDRTFDVTYDNMDTNPILSQAPNVTQNNRTSEGGTDDIEMQGFQFKGHSR
ncbi:hypothetical protein KVR01_012677 [Diaporthe batatas]|uniref:uncharacterized protein n=1 Tax=Diaporthe batatas TaxID=748121 RepID=UPI001D050CBD|nr:uncharacterized protein KVR01_012677 [Diaporthe batatas]KAG8157635.1 hypothetical protein KVR01_012677 [Diaporthe batatas]